MRWELEDIGGGMRSLAHLLNGTPIGRTVGPDALKFSGWQRLNAEYARQFGMES